MLIDTDARLSENDWLMLHRTVGSRKIRIVVYKLANGMRPRQLAAQTRLTEEQAAAAFKLFWGHSADEVLARDRARAARIAKGINPNHWRK